MDKLKEVDELATLIAIETSGKEKVNSYSIADLVIRLGYTRHPEKKDINTNPNPNTPNGSGHSGPCQEGCQCDIARAFSAPSPRYSDKQLDAIVDKIRESDSPYPQIPSNGVEYRRGFIDGIEEYKKKAPSVDMDVIEALCKVRNILIRLKKNNPMELQIIGICEEILSKYPMKPQSTT